MIPGLGLLRTLKRAVLLIALPLGVVISGIYVGRLGDVNGVLGLT